MALGPQKACELRCVTRHVHARIYRQSYIEREAFNAYTNSADRRHDTRYDRRCIEKTPTRACTQIAVSVKGSMHLSM